MNATDCSTLLTHPNHDLDADFQSTASYGHNL